MNRMPVVARAIGGISFLWYALGTIGLIGSLSLTAEDLQQLPQASREAMALLPGWVGPVGLLSLGAGLAGSLSLLVLRRWAFPCFVAALVTNVPYAFAAIVIGDGYRLFGLFSLLTQLGTLAIAAALAWFAHTGVRRRWLT